jgi:hypothetical protein
MIQISRNLQKMLLIGPIRQAASEHKTRRIHGDIGHPDRGDDPRPSSLSGTQSDENDLVLRAVDRLSQRCFKLGFFRRIKIAFEYRELEVVSEILACPEDSAEPFRVGDIVTD